MRNSWLITASLMILVLGTLLATQTNTSVALVEYTVKVATMPSTPGAQVIFDGDPFTAGADGNFSIMRPPGNYSLSAVEQTQLSSNSLATFARWGDLPDGFGTNQSFNRTRNIDLKSNQDLLLLLTISHRVSMVFTAQQGEVIDQGRVENAFLQASDGQPYLLTAYENLWFRANRFQRLQPPVNWKIIYLTYTLTSANVGSQNVVQGGLYKFTPAPGVVWTVSLQLYDLRISVSDMFFGFPLDSSVRITDLSEGNEIRTGLTEGGNLVLQDFPRGDYVIHVSGLGLALPVPIVFSNSTSLAVKIFSLFDMLLTAISGLAVVVIWLRPKLLRAIWIRLTARLGSKQF